MSKKIISAALTEGQVRSESSSLTDDELSVVAGGCPFVDAVMKAYRGYRKVEIEIGPVEILTTA